MKFQALESSELKNKYFYRTEKWDWLNRDMIYLIDSKSPRMITMDYWPQKIYLEADGQKTVSEFIQNIASKYPKTAIPKNLDASLLHEITGLIEGGPFIALSDHAVELDPVILNPQTEEGKIDMEGSWTGSYTYNMPEEFKDEKTKEVGFTIKINKTVANIFEGSVEDDLSTGGTQGIGKIAGSYTDYEMSFKKDMPIRSMIKDNGERIIDKKQKHPTIIYEGEFSRDKKTVTGVWRFKRKVLLWKGFIPFWVAPGTGNFKMTKKNE